MILEKQEWNKPKAIRRKETIDIIMKMNEVENRKQRKSL